MMLSEEDVNRLEKAGFNRDEFAVRGRDGILRLRNRDGWCVFYDPEGRRCKVYPHRPLGCRLYPIIYVEGVGVTVDELCPMRHTVSKDELRRKGEILIKHINRILSERRG